MLKISYRTATPRLACERLYLSLNFESEKPFGK